MGNERHAQFTVALNNLGAIGAFIAECMRNASLSDEHINNFEVSVDEHISNLIEHAFPDENDRTVQITCRDDEEKAQVVITDASEGFDPRNYTIPDVEDRAIYELPPGGFGNYFICELMDDVQYSQNPHVENRLTLTIYKTSS